MGKGSAYEAKPAAPYVPHPGHMSTAPLPGPTPSSCVYAPRTMLLTGVGSLREVPPPVLAALPGPGLTALRVPPTSPGGSVGVAASAEDPARAQYVALALAMARFIEEKEEGPSLFDVLYISPKSLLGVVAYVVAAGITYVYQEIRNVM
jgi:hypothetical protein